MSLPVAVPCADASCQRTTTDPSGACQDHRAGRRQSAGETGRASVPSPASTYTAPVDQEQGDSPTVVEHYPDGTVKKKSWHLLDDPGHILWNEEGPALLEYHPDGSLAREEWYEDGEPHRYDGPAITFRTIDGARREDFYLDGSLHRIDGHAECLTYSDGSKTGSGPHFRGVPVGPKKLAAALTRLDPSTWRSEIARSSYQTFLDEGFTKEELHEAIGLGIRTPEGFRQVRSGAPEEWVRAYEEGQS